MVTQATNSWNPNEVALPGGVAPEMNPLVGDTVLLPRQDRFSFGAPLGIGTGLDFRLPAGPRAEGDPSGPVCSSDPFDDFEDDDFDDEFDDDFEEEWDDDLGDSEYADEFPPDEDEESDDDDFNDDPDFDDE